MDIIDQMYENYIGEEENFSSEHKLSNEVYQILKRENYEDEGKMSELLFEVAACGQQEGFRAGFQVAVALLVECLG